jgi:hypothetical protein
MTIPMRRLYPGRANLNRRPDYHPSVARSLVQRSHNPRKRACHCDPDCWCRRTMLGRAVKWWFPARYFGLGHKASFE